MVGTVGSRVVVAAAVVAATVLAGCSENDTTAPASSTGTHSAETTAAQGGISAPGATRSTSEVGAAPTATAPASTTGVAACGPGHLDIGAQTLSPGMLHRGVQLNFSLAADTPPCTLSGYPGVDTGEGGPVLHAERTPRGYMGGLPQGDDTPPVVTVLPGHPARAIVEGSAMGSSGEDCPLYTSLQVTAPNSTDTRTLHTTIDTCALQVHPVTN